MTKNTIIEVIEVQEGEFASAVHITKTKQAIKTIIVLDTIKEQIKDALDEKFGRDFIDAQLEKCRNNHLKLVRDMSKK